MKANPLDYQRATDQVESWIEAGKTRFVSIASVNNVVCSLKDPALMDIQNQADMVTTDGKPLVWILRNRGHKDCSRVYGPTLMLHVLAMAEANGYSIYLYGCTDEIIEKLMQNLKERYPKLQIAGHYAPPFRPLTEEENDEVVSKINASGASLVFVGLSSPKQEQWMHHNRPKLQNTIMLGVGAAFLFHAGMVKQAPAVLQNMGLEWLFRLVMEPKRLWKRYIFGNSFFLWRLFLSKFKKCP